MVTLSSRVTTLRTPALKPLDSTPESPAIVFLRLDSDGILQNLNTPLLLKIGPFT